MAERGVGKGRVTYHSPPPRRPKCVALTHRFLDPSPIVRARIGPADQHWLAFYVDVDEATEQPVRLGWVIGSAGELDVSKQRLVRPRGDMQPSAPEPCSVTEAAREEGSSIELVLNELLQDSLDVGMEGGRLLAHDLTLHGGIVERELRRCALGAVLQPHAE